MRRVKLLLCNGTGQFSDVLLQAGQGFALRMIVFFPAPLALTPALSQRERESYRPVAYPWGLFPLL